ncbi:3-deoxy-D-manno-octulosonate 8-phosphate phosphatase KdsC [bacterium BMS3Bbin12]|nr:3-deoxy-D-manno-octulosonate 8-phosphate phosphatase KdsC [bacterium BMS3Bbin12]GBE51476.1 3-deoxy-D-manno-octulosonate 8-phosphate phosphatase KdsC [bacterium BMS3Bbin13]
MEMTDGLRTRAARVRLLVFDVDGVLTDGSLYLGDDGREYKAFHSRDGHGMKMLMDSGVQIAIITGRESEVVRCRMADLGVRHVLQGRTDKAAAFRHLLDELHVDAEDTAYVGDDVVDIPAMRRAGLAIAVRDAHPLVVRNAHWVSAVEGGRGAAREVCELIMDARGTLDEQLSRFL